MVRAFYIETEMITSSPIHQRRLEQVVTLQHYCLVLSLKDHLVSIYIYIYIYIFIYIYIYIYDEEYNNIKSVGYVPNQNPVVTKEAN